MSLGLGGVLSESHRKVYLRGQGHWAFDLGVSLALTLGCFFHATNVQWLSRADILLEVAWIAESFG